ncbi:MAG: Gfo/Idh/MocA family oxidoreductase [Planctomycetaceae bacterium]|jgi:predicted dehydrogenase|nr:Gfo/Idh/MocA family oxidoreductase [Planctomycetaceae bacterium]
MKRRDFMAIGAAAGAGLMAEPLTGPLFADDGIETAGPVRAALAGCGRQGRAILNAGLRIPNFRFVALCDIQPTAVRSAKLYLESEDIEAADYTDFREMAAHEKANIDVVLIATPDFVHAEQTLAALETGWDVYCEPMMATNIEDARQMIRSAKKTGKILQVAFERRSDPRYRHVAEKFLDRESRDLLWGTVTHFETQANRRVHSELLWTQRDTLTDDYLKRYGYESMSQYRNWKQYRKYGNGQCAANFSQQFDVFEWFFGSRPREIRAMGGLDYYTFGDCYDNTAALLAYNLDDKTVRASGRVRMTTSGGGNLPFEHVYGVNGSVQTSLSESFFRFHAEPGFAKWNEFVRRGDLKRENLAAEGEDPNLIHVRETGNVVPYLIPVLRPDSIVRLHLENFVHAVLGKETPNCPAEAAFPAHVIAWKIAEAAETGQTVTLNDESFAL